MLVTSEYPETVTAAQVIADNLAPLGITVEHPHRRLRHLARRAELRQLRHADDGLARQHRPRRLLLRPAPHRRLEQRPEVLQPRGRPAAGRRPGARPIGKRDNEDYAKAATIIADQVSYIYLYNPSVIQAWTPRLSGYEARRDGAIRFKTASLTAEVAMTR